MRYLIVNADDFGLSPGVNQGIIEAHERGIVTSASLMVRWPAAAEAAAYSRAHPEISLGLHVDLGEWAYHEGNWVPVYEVVSLTDIRAIMAEVTRQVTIFRRLAGRYPTHVDSHQHVHRTEPVRSVLHELAYRLGIPLRHNSPRIHYCGDFYGQTGKEVPIPGAITVERLIDILVALPAGTTEVSCHPGKGNDVESVYRNERAQEVKVLCDPRVRTTLVTEGIKLCSYRNIAIDG
ncbi:MAG TPA: ChbG/HpnK family deacetylase [Anaerolineae bacterium]